MKDYLIKFNSDGRRGTTYADGVHYFVDQAGNVTDGSINVQELLEQGYEFVDFEDYNNLLANNDDNQEYCKQADGTFAPYVAPEPTAEEKAATEKASLAAEYESNKTEMLTALQAATLAGNADAVSSIQQDYQDMTAAYKAAVEGVTAE
ncbi:hypothetical protein [Acidaminococcus intestini]|uniref:hypothetical protein n=1 Tax=Acidaminococcus intestini TaxID=187327 RepID=UPI00307E0AFE